MKNILKKLILTLIPVALISCGSPLEYDYEARTKIYIQCVDALNNIDYKSNEYDKAKMILDYCSAYSRKASAINPHREEKE